MTTENTHIICGECCGKKYEKAIEWNIEIINHIWLEESYRNRCVQALTKPLYTYYPPQLNSIVGDIYVEWNNHQHIVSLFQQGVTTTTSSSKEVNENYHESEEMSNQLSNVNNSIKSFDTNANSNIYTNNTSTSSPQIIGTLRPVEDKNDLLKTPLSKNRKSKLNDIITISSDSSLKDNNKAILIQSDNQSASSKMRVKKDTSTILTKKDIKNHNDKTNIINNNNNNDDDDDKDDKDDDNSNNNNNNINNVNNKRNNSIENNNNKINNSSNNSKNNDNNNDSKKRKFLSIDGTPSKKLKRVDEDYNNPNNNNNNSIVVVNDDNSTNNSLKAIKSPQDFSKIPTSNEKVFNIMFTGMKPTKEDIKKIKSLGGNFVNNINQCTHLLTKKIAKTEKFIIGISICKYIINYQWLNSSYYAGRMLDESQFPLIDKLIEKEFSFSLKKTLNSSKHKKILENRGFIITPNVSPSREVLTRIIISAGGEVYPEGTLLNSLKVTDFIISSPQDKDLWSFYSSKGFKVYNADFVLFGILRQELPIKNKLLILA
jgi:hypothetical protein